MTRLEILCKVHKQQGGTIFQFNDKYKVDFILMSEDSFYRYITAIEPNFIKRKFEDATGDFYYIIDNKEVYLWLQLLGIKRRLKYGRIIMLSIPSILMVGILWRYIDKYEQSLRITML